MADGIHYTVLGNAEAYLEEATRVRGGQLTPPHRSLEAARRALIPQIEAVQAAVQAMPESHRLDEVVVEMRIDASRIAKSYHPAKLLQESSLHLRGIGAWSQERLIRTRGRRKQHADAAPAIEHSQAPMACRSLLVSGTEAAFKSFRERIATISSADRFVRDVIGIENIRILTAAEHLTIRGLESDQVAIEIVLYSWDEIRRDQAIAGIKRVIGTVGVHQDQILVRSYAGGPTFLAAVVPGKVLPMLAALNTLQENGIAVGKKRVERLMKAAGVAVLPLRRFVTTTDSDHDQPIAPNVLEQDFTATAPNQRWVTDITYIRTGEGWLFLAAIVDLYSRKIVGWAMQPTMHRSLVLKALAMAVADRQPKAGLIHHSDRGSQYASDDYRAALHAHGMVASMSRRGCCYDNAVAESFWHTLKNELIYRHEYQTRHEAQSAIFEYIEVFYNKIRCHTAIGNLSPMDFELQRAKAA